MKQRFAIVTVTTLLSTVFCIDDTVANLHSVSTHRWKHEAELEAMTLNCEADSEEINLHSPWLDSAWV